MSNDPMIGKMTTFRQVDRSQIHHLREAAHKREKEEEKAKVKKIKPVKVKYRKMSKTVRDSIRSGHVPVLRNWRELKYEQLTQGEKVCRFIEHYIIIPEGNLVGQPMRLLEFQEVFILAIFDGDRRARRAILSVGRKAGKTALLAALMLTIMFMGLCPANSQLNSGGLTREQAALVFNYMSKMIGLSERLSKLAKATPSGKKIVCFNSKTEYKALAADGSKAMGLSPVVAILDEVGQVVGATNLFVDSILTSQGAHDDPLTVMISTQAPSDADFLSITIDDITRSPSDDTVCHLYTADINLDIDDPEAWRQACPAIGQFRNMDDVRIQAEEAKRLPQREARFRNLILNQRVSLETLFIAPTVWKENDRKPNIEQFSKRPVTIGLDLSQRSDLTAAVFAVDEPETGFVHVLPFVFVPLEGISEREQRDKAAYQTWIKQGQLIAVPGSVIEYGWVFEFLRLKVEELDMTVSSVEFDRWRITEAKSAAQRKGFFSPRWHEVGQGYKDMSPRIEALETALLTKSICHGSHPLLNMAASQAIATQDPSGNRKLDKSKTTQRIDPLVAMLMAVYPYIADDVNEFDVGVLIG